MSDTQAPRSLEGMNPRQVALLLAILAAWAGFAWWTTQRTDRQMRHDLLQQTRLVARAVDIERVQSLSGTEADLISPNYQRLKEQLTGARFANPQCRFLYLMGRRADGVVFFLVDSEPIGSRDYSPPGQIFEEVSEEFRRALDTKTAIVEGPVSDRWGVWVSALEPLIDPQTGDILAVVGMDINARNWEWDLAARAALPIGLSLVVIIILVGALALNSRADASPKPLLRRLLPPLAAMVIILLACSGLLLWKMQKDRLAEGVANSISKASHDLRMALDHQALVLDAALRPITTDAGLRESLRERDVDRLLAVWRPMFETLKTENVITHLYFLDPDRLCLLRIHNPEKRGDRIERFTVVEAERTGMSASGIELGQRGTLTLRVVQPVFDDGQLVGYVELGKDVVHVLQTLRERSGVELSLVIRKERLNRQRWEEGMHRLGRETDWERFSQNVVIYASQGRLPEAFASLADLGPASDHAQGTTDREVVAEGRNWQVVALPFQDASGKEIGDFLVMRDITAEKEAFSRLMGLAGTAGGVVLVLVLSFVYVLLSRSDRGIRAQQAELEENQARWQFALEGAGDGVWDWNAQTNDVFFSSRWKSMLGFEEHEIGNTLAEWDTRLHPDDRRHVYAELDKHLAGQNPVYVSEYRLKCKDGTYKWILDRGKVIQWSEDGKPLRVIGTHTDMTERMRAREERQRLQAQLMQAQKMESVGRLAGGVAHDFNNMLGVIIGRAEMAELRLGKPAAVARNLHEILRAARRSVNLVGQLLAYARKQTVSPKVLDLNETVAGMVAMLRRLIGEDIDLAWMPGTGLWPVNMDPNQVDQILANLAVNARDAIGGVGKVTIETRNVTLNEAACFAQTDLVSGAYVLLAVSDTGAGMDEETLENIFEPFFTTKGVGRGTGLGLATVYGIVKQNEGFIDVSSEPGKGSTFRILLPGLVGETAEIQAETAPEAPRGRGETVLLVEDEATMLNMGQAMLEHLGYTVLTAGAPGEAMRQVEGYPGEIRLLMTDVVMPEMNGRDLAERLSAFNPGLKCLYMSGYTADVIAHRGVIDKDVHFIQKPFSIQDLALKVREVLEG